MAEAAQTTPPFVVDTATAQQEVIEILKNQITFMEQRIFVMAQMIKNKDAEIAALRQQIPALAKDEVISVADDMARKRGLGIVN